MKFIISFSIIPWGLNYLIIIIKKLLKLERLISVTEYEVIK